MRSVSRMKACSFPVSLCGVYSLLRRASMCLRGKHAQGWGVLFMALVLLTPKVFGEGSPRVTGVEPASGKVNGSCTVLGENLGKESISAVLLSDEKTDFKATITDQASDKVSIKVPEVKPGDYNISIQVGNNIFIQPVRFKVEE